MTVVCRLIMSVPPPIAQSSKPEMIWLAASATEVIEEPQARSSVIALALTS